MKQTEQILRLCSLVVTIYKVSTVVLRVVLGPKIEIMTPASDPSWRSKEGRRSLTLRFLIISQYVTAALFNTIKG